MRLWVQSFFAALLLPVSAFCASGQDGGQHGRTSYILAASWEPAFCATNGKKAECRSEKAGGYNASNFSLHGLWPMREQYCDVADDLQHADQHSDWNSLPEVELSAKTRSALAKAMPGTQSGLERHEWIKHGSCTKLSADEYFTGAVGLIEELNASAVRDLFAENIGKTLNAEAIKAAFDKSFGEGASARVKMSCRRVGETRVISELTIGLSEDAIAPDPSGPRLETLIQGAGGTQFGCDQGVVQAVGS